LPLTDTLENGNCNVIKKQWKKNIIICQDKKETLTDLYIVRSTWKHTVNNISENILYDSICQKYLLEKCLI
jgi:hypothetical protein